MRELTLTRLARRVEHLEQELARYRAEAMTDALTGLGNLRALQELGRGWFVLADLDGFKGAQDADPRGHELGDDVLREFSAFLVRSCRSSRDDEQRDHVAVRRGGDEFVVWCRSEAGARAVRARLAAWRSALAPVTCSAGAGATLAEADAAMYAEKREKVA